MSKLKERLEEYLLDNGYWPLFVPFIFIPSLYEYVRAYYEFATFKEAIDYPLFRSGSIIIIAASIFILIVLKSWRWIKEKSLISLPKDKIVVLVTNFHELGQAKDEKGGSTIAHRIVEDLKAKIKEGAPLVIKQLNTEIQLIGDESLETAVRRIGKMTKTRAHMALTGTIRKEDGELYIKPEIVVFEKSGNTEVATIEMPKGTTIQGPDEFNYLALRETIAENTADTLILITAMSYYKTKDYSNALALIETITTSEAAFYQGNIYSEIASLSTDPVSKYNEAITAYNRALVTVNQESNPHNWASIQSNMGIALQRLGELTNEAEWYGYINMAVNAYCASLKERKKESTPLKWAETKSNLGSAYSVIAERIGGIEGNKYYLKSEAAYNEALTVQGIQSNSQAKAITLNNLGATLASHGRHLEGEKGLKYLHKGEAAFREVLKIRNRKSDPLLWASAKRNLGNILSDIGERSKGDEGIVYMNDAISAYSEALNEIRVDNMYQQWASTKMSLACTYSKIGERIGGGKGFNYLNKALKIFQLIENEIKQDQLPQDWAMVQNSLGNTLLCISKYVEDREKKAYLTEAIIAYSKALIEQKRATLPQKWAMTNLNRAVAMMRLGIIYGNTAGLRFLGDSVAAYNSVIEVVSESSPYLSNMATRNKRIALDAIDRLKEK